MSDDFCVPKGKNWDEAKAIADAAANAALRVAAKAVVEKTVAVKPSAKETIVE